MYRDRSGEFVCRYGAQRVKAGFDIYYLLSFEKVLVPAFSLYGSRINDSPPSYAHAGFVQSLEFWKIEIKPGKNGKKAWVFF